ncbi:hypothetical protein OROMI_019673 [Orobanche minor]
MDVKALAKSKRAHSNHHSKKHHPHQASKAAAPSIALDNKKPTGKQAKGKLPQPHVTKPLPSNWERYNENLDLDFEEAQPSSSHPTEFVVPKSKGADYAHLISDAKDQFRSNYFSHSFHSLNDVINDFGPLLLAAKGQSILSWVSDDDFEFEEKTSTSVEVFHVKMSFHLYEIYQPPFLSLNLNTLAEQLAKAKLSKRCFLDPNLFPLELLDDELQAREEDKHDSQTCTPVAETDFLASSLDHNQEFIKNGEQYHESSSVSVTKKNHVRTSKGELKPQGTVRSISLESISNCKFDSSDKNTSMFQATSAEAELDMLLSSFGETKINESSRASPMSVAAVSSETVKKRTHMMETRNLDGDIDKLLEETSNLARIDGRQVSNEVRSSPDVVPSSALNPCSKSKRLDDFDSWLDTI